MEINIIDSLDSAREAFLPYFPKDGDVKFYRSPGRVNLIGEHTDYNGGFSLPAPINKAIYFGICKTETEEKNLDDCIMDCEFYAFNKDASYKATSPERIGQRSFITFDYLLGGLNRIFEILKERNLCKEFKFKCVFGGNLPMGLGISSSTALSVGFIYAVNDLYSLNFTREEIALIGQYTEHNYIGVKGGLLDQTAILFGEKNSVLKIDFLNNEKELIKVKTEGFSIVLIDSNEERQLAESGYNDRTKECKRFLDIINQKYPNNNGKELNFRDISEEQYKELLEEYENNNEDLICIKRGFYVYKENIRVEEFIKALEAGNWSKIGELLYSSHEGLSKEYEVSTERLDNLVDLAKKAEGVIGARMMGGGFGGCTINLVFKGKEEEFINSVKNGFKDIYGEDLLCLLTEIDDGVKKLL